MEREIPATPNPPARTIVARVLAIVLSVVLVETLSWAWLRAAGWYDSWSYVTVSDPELWIALRPGARARLRGVEVAIDRSGLRDASTDEVVEPKRDGEYLVVALGDSNVFGNLVPFDRLATTRLETALGARLGRRVRVVNLAVPSHSTVQSKGMLARWMRLRPDAVVLADSLNDRGFAAKPDSEMLEKRLFEGERPWEVGPYLLHSVCLARLLTAPPLRKIPLDGPLPLSRVPLEEYRKTLEEIVRMSRDAGATIVFLATGDDPEIAALARGGLEDVREKRFEEAERRFDELVRKRPAWFLPRFYRDLAIRERGGDRGAELGEYRASDAGLSYLTRFVRFAFEYDDVMRESAASLGVPLVDMTGPFEERRVEFRDVCHYSAEGHALVAEALARVLSETAADPSRGGR